jgi:hypothetical protein
MEEQQKILEKELEPFIQLPATSTFASSLYSDLVSSKEIDQFLNSKKTDVYNKNRWALPRSDTNLLEGAMYEPLVRLLNAILEWGWKNVDVTAERPSTRTSQTSITRNLCPPTIVPAPISQSRRRDPPFSSQINAPKMLMFKLSTQTSLPFWRSK